MAKSRGRETDYTIRLAKSICKEIIAGKSLRQIGAMNSMPTKTTIMNWLASGKHEEFVEMYRRAKMWQAEGMADDMLDIADDGTNDWVEREDKTGAKKLLVDHEHINRSRLRVDTRKFIAVKLLPKVYGDKIELSGKGKDGAISVELSLAGLLAEIDGKDLGPPSQRD